MQTQKLEEARSQAATRLDEEVVKVQRLQEELDATADLRQQCVALQAETDKLRTALSSLQVSSSFPPSWTSSLAKH